jgi:hypothetical protein
MQTWTRKQVANFERFGLNAKKNKITTSIEKTLKHTSKDKQGF